MTRRIAWIAVVAVAVTACAGLLPGTARLPTDPAWPGGCGVGVGLDAVLHGSTSDPRVVWAADRSSGDRIDLVWPAGYGARFNPGLEVLDASGAIVAREGDLLIGRCVTDQPGEGPAPVDASDIRPPTWQPGDG